MAPTDEQSTPDLQPDVPHAARIWNYWMGGKDNFAADRAAGDGVAQVPEGRMVFAELTVEENLRIGATARKGGFAPEEMDRIFELFPQTHHVEAVVRLDRARGPAPGPPPG